MSFKLSELDPNLRKRVTEQMVAEDAAKGLLTPELVVAASAKSLAKEFKDLDVAKKSVKRLRQEQGPLMNKLEGDWFNHLKYVGFNGRGIDHLRAQSMRFRLGNGAWYRPDVTGHVLGKLTCFECKGPKEMRGMAKGTMTVKVAASKYPEIDWFYVYRDAGGAWRWERVLP